MQQAGLINSSQPVQPLLSSLPVKPAPKQLIQVGGAENFESASVQGAMRMRTAGSPSPYAGFNPFLNKAVGIMAACQKAELTVVGDPYAPINGQVIQVNNNYPITYANLNDTPSQDYSSGQWMIVKAVHSISISGVYLTTFGLNRYG
jgi:hypothetical protein